MAPSLEVSCAGDGWAVGRFGNVVLLFHQRSTPDYAVDRSVDLIDRAIAKCRSGIILVAIFAEGAPAPSLRGRRTIAQRLARNASKIVMGATVIEGNSVRSIAVRTATAMMLMLLRSPCPHKVFEDVASACRFIEPKAMVEGAPLAMGGLLEGIQSLRAAAQAQVQVPPADPS